MTDQPLGQPPPDQQTETSQHSPDRASNAQDLDFPQILLQASFSSLLSHSFPSNSSTSASTVNMANPGRRSLSESWASLSNSEYAADDDLQSENTDLGSLMDVHDSEDVHSIDDQDEEDEDNSSESGLPNLNVEDDTSVPRTTEPQADDQPKQTSQTSAVSQSQDFESIEFAEPEQWPEVGRIDVKHTLKVFPEDEAEILRDSLQLRGTSSQLVGTIRMTMSKSSLPLHQPFRVLYNGRSTGMYLRADILQTLAVALISSGDTGSYYRNLESSRYHVIPSAFGPGASPDHATMVPIQTQLIVDECIDATSLEDSSGQEQIILSLKNRDIIHSRWDGIWQSVQERRRWNCPDVAVLLVSKEKDTNAEKQTTKLMHECMLRHSIPTLVISEDSSWSASSPSLALDPQGLHRCIEAKTSSTTGGRVVRRLPIDLETFNNLDPEQLNKHLACLNDIAKCREIATPKAVSFMAAETRKTRPVESLNDVEKNLSKSYMAQHPKLDFDRALTKVRENMVVVALVAILIGFIFSISPTMPGSGIIAAQPHSPKTTTVTVAESVVTSSISVALQTKTTSAKSSPSDVPAVRGETDLAKLLSESAMVSVNKSDKFQVEIIGDCHIVVKAPKMLFQKRKEPKIQLQVTRARQMLNVEVSKPFDGVYAVKLDRDQAHGFLNLTIIVPKTSINETIELDFGSPWFKMANWDTAGQRFLAQLLKDVEQVRSLMQLAREKSRFNPQWSNTTVVSQRMQDFQAASAIARRSLLQLAANARIMAQELRKRSKASHQIAAARLEDAHLTMSALMKSSEKVRKQTAEYTEIMVVTMKEYVESARKTLSETDIPDLRAKLPDVNHSETLAKAQDRAQKIIRDLAKKLKQYRQDAARRKAHAKKRCKRDSRK